MNTYKLTLRPRGPFATPWQSDTLFGHLCWAKARRDGPDELGALLQLFREGTPPFVLSSAFPGDLLPRPLASRSPKRDSPQEDFEAGKKFRKLPFLPLAEFEKARRGEPVSADVPQPFAKSESLHATISRTTGTTGSPGSLYSLEETWLDPSIFDHLSVYAFIEPGYEDELCGLVEAVAASGYGKKRSTGKGWFEFGGAEPFHFAPVESPDGFVTLGNLVPSSKDPVDGLYRLFVKFGKLGEERSLGGYPFKRPLVLFEPGACFRDPGPRSFYGRIVEGISDAYPDAVQCGLAPALPLRWPAERGGGD